LRKALPPYSRPLPPQQFRPREVSPTDSSLHNSLVQSALQATIHQALQNCRHQTLALVADINAEVLSTQSHLDYSPVGWHLGHIAHTESLWIAKHLAGLPQFFPPGCPCWERMFAADGLPKAERQNLPPLEDLLNYLAVVRSQTIYHLENTDLHRAARLWHWLIQHESQHIEIMTMVLAMHGQQVEKRMPARQPNAEMICIEAGEFRQGSDALTALDNEQPAHTIWLDRYWIEPTPVTCGQYKQFIAAGGYQTAKWWSPQGWQWQQQAKVTQPLYWQESSDHGHHPVCGVSWYEADAYARFVGKRLPTEAEWEKATCTEAIYSQTIGHVWEWTNSWFAGYSGFNPFPYEGYSQIYFDGAHRVLRGGSWATPQWARRNSFRNWYHPHRRELFAGFRCAA
jgi:gamma-glutamyl hercynylcysteine S-oxide synthase